MVILNLVGTMPTDPFFYWQRDWEGVPSIFIYKLALLLGFAIGTQK